MKTTIRLPDDLAAALRRRSQEERRSLNATLVDTLRRGLEHEPEAVDWHARMDGVLLRPPLRPFDEADLQRLPQVSRGTAAAIEDALAWAREDR